MKQQQAPAAPGQTISIGDAVSIIIGIVIGAGIFKTPSVVAANAGSEQVLLLLWVAGGVISFIGALCYAELGSAYPDAGGDYHYLVRAFGRAPGFLFAWARMTVIQSGSIAMLAFLIGDYVSQVVRLGEYSSSWYAAAVIVLLTVINVFGIRMGSWVQKMFVVVIALGFGVLFSVAFGVATPSVHQGADETHGAIGKAMIFVLLTYGGWNEAAYLSAEVRGERRNIVKALLYSIAMITLVYVMANIAFVKSLGLTGMSGSDAVAADVMRRVLGVEGVYFITLLVSLAALSTINGSIITGARTSYALGRDFRVFRFLGNWSAGGGTPVNALLVQGAISLALVAVGTRSRSGFATMVEYTAPVFWLFLLLVGISLFVLRRRDPHVPRPFVVPFYPATPILFCLVCLYMLWSSLIHTGKGAVVGIAILLAGVPLLLLRNKKSEREEAK
ncbi:APC family permease [Geobacter sp. DSM 9736]|uniref:APC family permease n=1 Tax=Geobacter sp. DSM 9736 TaxID=1277350 RepID=UPI000B505AA4|nr:amino acid permease [Geobacter sp. DSM 9736]SNB47181.1 amino acid/polyamine/organocation transporter, APC superfamily [Geobacter sp. DSM 9736]